MTEAEKQAFREMAAINKDLERLQMIADDMEADAKAFDGKPFNGRTVGELHGNLCAAVQALALIIKSQLERKQ